MGNLYSRCRSSCPCCQSKDKENNNQDPRHLFLFVGPKGAGKSTAIQNLFGNPKLNQVPIPPQSASTIAEIHYLSNNYKIVEAPGFYNGISVHNNATVLVSISKYLEHQNEKPTGLFIMARVNDSRSFEDYDFMQQLKTLSLLNKTSAKLNADNVVLLLTHEDNTISNGAEGKAEIVKAYRNDFKKVLNFEPVCITVNVTSHSVNDVIEQLGQEKKHLKSGKLHALLEKHLQKQKTQALNKVERDIKMIDATDLPAVSEPDEKRHQEFASVLERHNGNSNAGFTS